MALIIIISKGNSNFAVFAKAFKNFVKYIIAFILTKFKYFAKQIIYLESLDDPLQNDI